MAQTKKDDYPLPRSSAEAARLGDQHSNTVEILGFLIHPAIGTDKQDLRVADLGCGSGAFLIDVATRFGNAQCDGFDISAGCFPEDLSIFHQFGNRVRFHEQDTADAEGFPTEYEGAFDIVCLRYVHITMRGDQWSRAASNVARLLKPGGWVQWVDWDPLTARIAWKQPLAPAAGLGAMLQCFQRTLRETRDTTQTNRIPDLLRVNGLTDARSELYALDRTEKTTMFFTTTVLTSVPELIIATLRNGHEMPGWDEARITELSKVVAEDLKLGGAYLRAEIFCHVARRPL